jgi:hypothetical protein
MHFTCMNDRLGPWSRFTTFEQWPHRGEELQSRPARPRMWSSSIGALVAEEAYALVSSFISPSFKCWFRSKVYRFDASILRLEEGALREELSEFFPWQPTAIHACVGCCLLGTLSPPIHGTLSPPIHACVKKPPADPSNLVNSDKFSGRSRDSIREERVI